MIAPSDPLERLRLDRCFVRSVTAKHTADVLVNQPEQFHGLEVGDVLTRIPYVTRVRAGRWLARAGVNPWRPAEQLTERERALIAGQLVLFSRNPSA